MPNNEPTAPEPSSPDPRPVALTCERCEAPVLDTTGPCPACMFLAARHTPSGLGASFEPPPLAEVARALPAYEVQLLIGQGGMGAVYRARHRKLDRLVAIKILRPQQGGSTTNEAAAAAAFTERFEREARVLAKLDHPHIVRIYDFGRGEGEAPFFYLVLEFVDGASLRDLMREGRLTAREALALIPQVCDALHMAHALGVVHRDIKPENILVDGDGRVRIADFGLAKLKENDGDALPLTQTHEAFGTPHYMAPEQMRGSGAVDHRADLYSLGVVLYELLTGELPLGRFAAPSSKTDSPSGLDDVVFRALATEPDERYQEASEIKSDLEGDAKADAGGVTRSSPGRYRRKQLRRKRRQESKDPAHPSEWPDKRGSSRTWSFALVLFALHLGPWAWVAADAGKLWGSSTPLYREGGADFMRLSGFQLRLLGVPVSLALLFLVLSAVVRWVWTDEESTDPRFAYRLAHTATVLMLVTLFTAIAVHHIVQLQVSFFLALALYAVNSWIDDGEYRRLQVHAKRAKAGLASREEIDDR